MEKAAKVKQVHMSGFKFNMEGLNAGVQDNVLHLEMPALLLRSNLIHEQAMEDLTNAGFSEQDVENETNEMIERLQALQLGRMLQKRRI